MLIENLSSKIQSFELVHAQQGYCRVLARVKAQLLGGSLCKIVYSSVGFVAVAASAQTPEYFVGYVPVTTPAETLVELQVGGKTPLIRLYAGLEVGQWLSLADDQVRARSGEFPFLHEFAQVISVVDDTVNLMMLPRTVKESL